MAWSMRSLRRSSSGVSTFITCLTESTFFMGNLYVLFVNVEFIADCIDLVVETRSEDQTGRFCEWNELVEFSLPDV
jgi:hypothetical protein